MTQSTSHRRSPSSPHTSKQKSSRPNLHRRGTSAVNVSISKLGAGIGHSRASSKDDDAEVAMASFLNFCATCEKQITVPDNSLLYCSESCRKQDSCKPLSASKIEPSTGLTSPPPSTKNTSPNTVSTVPPTHRNIVTPMKPTSRTSLIRKPTTSFDGSADMDPTEWKPALNRAATSLGSSDAWAYLSSFYGSESLPARRNRSIASLPGRIETADTHTHTNMPALTHTPSTPSSSFSSDSSEELNLDAVNLTLSDVKSSLQPRTSKGVDLVTPVEKSIPVVVVDGPDVWENVRETHPHHHHSLSAPIAIVRAPHARMRTV